MYNFSNYLKGGFIFIHFFLSENIYNNNYAFLFAEFLLVHNGIITNYKDIKSFLVSSVYFIEVLCPDFF